MPLNGLFGYHLQCFMGIYFHYIGLNYIMKSTCYSWNTYIPVRNYQLNYITFFNSGNSSYHFKLMGCSSLPWPHRYRHKSQNEPVTKVTTIHFTPERSSPPVIITGREPRSGVKCIVVTIVTGLLWLVWRYRWGQVNLKTISTIPSH